MNSEKQTHFGYRKVTPKEKTNLIDEVFASVAPRYDLMNDVMSFGLHRYWKKFALQVAGLRSGLTVLDAASGTGDLAKQMSQKVGKQGRVFALDSNANMLKVGRDRHLDAAILQDIHYVQASVEALPFPEYYFDRIMIAFGLRNVTDKKLGLREFYRVLKPGGKLLVLEFSKPHSALLNTVYDFYSFNIIPKLGELIVQDKTSYQYLVESIRVHPDQKNLQILMEQNGFADVDFYNLSGGIVALHIGYKY